MSGSLRRAAFFVEDSASRSFRLLCKLVEDPAGEEVAKGGGEVGGGTVAGVAFDAAGHFFGAFGGCFSVAGGEFGLFGRENGGNFKLGGFFSGFWEAVVGPESLADGEEERVAEGAGEVVEADLGGVGSSSGPAAGNDGDVMVTAGGEEVAFCTDGVDGIDDGIGCRGKEFVGVLLGVEGLLDGAAGVGIDLEDAFGENDGFGLADGFGGCVDLAVGVGETEIVEVHEGELADAGAGQGFNGPGADSTESDHHDVGPGESFERSDAVKPGDASKSIEIVFGHGSILCPRCGLNKSEDSDNHAVTNHDDQRRCEQTEGICPTIFSHDAEPGGSFFFALESFESS